MAGETMIVVKHETRKTYGRYHLEIDRTDGDLIDVSERKVGRSD
jgi:hypothetical protein